MTNPGPRMIRRLWPMVALWLVFPAMLFPVSPVKPGRAGTGVVVESVFPGSATERAGLRSGDVVLSWERLPAPPANPKRARGKVRDFFRWLDLVWEQSPRGAVVLAGLRDGRGARWEVPRGAWDITVRPRLSPEAEALFREGEALVKAGRAEEGVARWEEVARRAADAGDRETACWAGLRSGEALAAARLPEQAHRAHASAMATARGIRDPRPRWAVSLAEGDARLLGRDFVGAAAGFRALRAETEALWGESLRLALILRRLSNAVRQSEPSSFSEAERHAQRAVALSERFAPDSLAMADALFSLGLVAFWEVNHPRAVTLWERALAIAEEQAPNGDLTMRVLYYLLDAAQCRGDIPQAKSFCERALHISRLRQPDGMFTARMLCTQGNLYWIENNFDRAEKSAREALAILQRNPPNPMLQSMVYGILGLVCSGRLDCRGALHWHTKSLELARGAGGEPSLEYANRLAHVAEALLCLGELDKARESYREVLDLMRAVSPDLPDIFFILEYLGRIDQRAGDLDAALRRFDEALAFANRVGLSARFKLLALFGIEDIRLQRGDLAGAEAVGREALAIATRLMPGTLKESHALGVMGRICRRQGRRTEALSCYRDAISALEQQMSTLGGSDEDRVDFRSRYAALYREYLELLLEAGEPGEAFHTLERYRARTFLEMLSMRELVFPGEVPEALDAEWKRLALETDAARRALAKHDMKADSREIDALHSRLRELQALREQLMVRIREASPRLASLRRPQPLDTEGARAALDPGTLLLSYSVGTDAITLFALSREEGLSVFPLAAGRERLTREVTAFRRLITAGATSPATRNAVTAAGCRLYDLLVRPAESRIETCQRILVVPDGPLHALPFAALVRKAPDGDPEGDCLVAWRPLHTAMSVTVFDELKRCRDKRGTADAGPVLVFGDPVYPPRGGSGGEAGEPNGDPPLHALPAGQGPLVSLPFTRAEAESIRAVYPEDAHVFLGEQATEERAKAAGRDVRILHFACHGILDEQNPLESALALTVPATPGGGDNGFLQAWEVMERMRLEAELVALSACNTALGSEAGGEGLVGLTRAFQYAGARSVLASLWSVADETTAVLMRRFYQCLATGVSRDQALRTAQMELLRGTARVEGGKGDPEPVDASHPFFWAAFQLVGDWR
ncbi:MAG: CHAT domain-containing protein [Acidobacteria bacterium]|nr:CHAT domain-containing protein [Acidobacteriota bacterium]